MDLDRDGLGKALKSIRNELGLSIEEVSFLAGINEKTIYRIEHGKNKVSMNTLDKLSVAYRRDLFAVYNRYVMNPESKLSNLINKAEKGLYIDDLKNIKMCTNQFKKLPLKQYTSYQRLFIKHYTRLLEATYIDLKHSDRFQAIKLLTDSIKSEIYDFQIIKYKNFNYSPIEKRILMNISTMKYDFHRDGLYIEILTYLLTLLGDNTLLYPKLILNLATLHNKKRNYNRSLHLTNKGIDYCIKNKSLEVLPKLFFRKFSSEVNLDIKGCEKTLEKAIFMSEINNQEYLKEIFISDAKEIYGIPIDNYFLFSPLTPLDNRTRL